MLQISMIQPWLVMDFEMVFRGYNVDLVHVERGLRFGLWRLRFGAYPYCSGDACHRPRGNEHFSCPQCMQICCSELRLGAEYERFSHTEA